MAPAKGASERILAVLLSRDWAPGGPPGDGPPFGHPPGWHYYLSPGAIAAIVLGIFFFLLLVGCICVTYSSRFKGRRRRSRSRSTRSYYADTTSYATRTAGGADSARVRGGGSDGQAYYYYYPAEYTTTAAAATGPGQMAAGNVRVSATTTRAKAAPKSVTSPSSPSSPSSASSQSSAASASTRGRAVSSNASDAATLAMGTEKKPSTMVEDVSSPVTLPRKMRSAKTRKQNGRRR
ncbi:hypothetical protein HMPREF1624_03648 [Sporothrix schenckii ATCC 58251]|uniref:Uncharacterized protein n=1 Tax=Sporothrix schenckii (strain ATCC 58251 / de Perez 2211183) TaxID=1391915 RepID=U7PZ92_SPOS1|nr:hypothetical protein HMPREF1624_03648 [Sporothrix schenckii ATCC 58251]